MADGLAVMWDDAKKTFEQMTGKKKPKESKGIFNAFGSYTGLSGALEKFDKAEDAANKTNTEKSSDLKAGNKLVDEMETQLGNYKKASASYTSVLGKEIGKEINERTEADVKTAYERALKYLNKVLASVQATGESRVAATRQRFNTAEKDLTAKEKMLLNWQNNVKAALARAAAAAGKVKASPTVATYNSIFPKAARDVTMQLVLAKDLDGFLMDPKVILQSMGPWGRQDGQEPATLPDDATQQDVVKNLVGFVKELKKAQQLVATKNAYSL
ncbi:MAG: hypothetical protein HIU82_08735 [Proteobacteria bacterium]|nr:hypothetical protein [Pseudomonadota bacterium]